MSASKTKYIVMLDDPDNDQHVCGAFAELSAALACIRDDHTFTGKPLENYRVEAWRGRQDCGTYNHLGELTAVVRAEAEEA